MIDIKTRFSVKNIQSIYFILDNPMSKNHLYEFKEKILGNFGHCPVRLNS